MGPITSERWLGRMLGKRAAGASTPVTAASAPRSPASRLVLQMTHPDAARQREPRLPGHAVASPALTTGQPAASAGLNAPRPGNGSRLGRDPGFREAPAACDDTRDVVELAKELLRRIKVGLLL